MESVTVSPKFKVVIPKKVREQLGIEPGQKVQVIVFDGRIELIPIMSIKNARGFLEGISSDIEREPDRV